MGPAKHDTNNHRDGAVAPQDLVPVPDEDGPHDVPDETVIEATLPTVPVPFADAG